MEDNSSECDNQIGASFHTNGMPAPSSLKTPCVMSGTKRAAWAQAERNTSPQLAGRFGISELTWNATNKCVGRCHSSTAYGVIA